MSSCALSPGACNTDLLGPGLAEICHASSFVFFMSILDSLVRKNNKISGLNERVVPVEIPDDEYDFVVIGGGAGGAPVAARLCEVPEWKVLLIEAGPDESPGSEIPLFSWPLVGTRVDWNYTSTNESHACLSTNGVCPVTAGRCLGGGSAHNQMVYIRGNPTDYNNWAALGNKGWTWDEVKPFFLKSEDNGEIHRVGRSYHSTKGPLSVERPPYITPFAKSIVAAGVEAGYGFTDDPNGAKVTGFTWHQTVSKNGVRRSSASAFLRPLRNRKNLHVSVNTLGTRVIFKDKKVVGVEYYKNGEFRRARVNKEVIISAGAIRSPHLLLLSGIGPKKHLKSQGVKVVHDLPGVGENLHDQVLMMFNFTINDTDTYDNDWAVANEYLKCQTGPLSSSGLSSVLGTLASSKTSPDYPDIRIFFMGYNVACAPGDLGALRSTGNRPGLLRVSYLHPKSRGRISLASKNSLEYPKIWFNYLSDPHDVEVLTEAIRLGLALAKTKVFRARNFTVSLTPDEACSHHKFGTDKYWNCAVRQRNPAVIHYGGSCKMGPASDSLAVVDPRLRVNGIKGLRVADTSIMPAVTSGNTAAPAIMIGERAADFIKKDWGRR